MLTENNLQERQNKKLILVLGMHRSGTSVITRGLTTMGVKLGDRLMPPVEGNNDKGFWEDLDVYALNVKMLEALGRNWHFLLPVSEEEAEALCDQGFLTQAVELLEKKVAACTVFGLKDPRMAKLQPFWQRVFKLCDFGVYYILPVRNPASIASSLLKRDAMPFEKSYFLWVGHTLAALLGSSGKNRIFIDYDQLLSAPDEQLERMSVFLDLGIDNKKATVYKNEFLESSLRHASYGLSDLMSIPECPSLAVEIYKAIMGRLEQGKESNFLRKEAESWKKRLDSDASLLKLADELSKQIDDAKNDVAIQTNLIIGLEREAAAQADHVSNIERVNVAQASHIIDIERVVQAQEGHITDLGRVTEAQGNHIAAQGNHITELEQAAVVQQQNVDFLGAEVKKFNSFISESYIVRALFNLYIKRH